MTSLDDIHNLQERLQLHRRTLSVYLKSAAMGGVKLDPEVLHGIHEARAQIAQIKQALRQLGAEVQDHFDDEQRADAPLAPRTPETQELASLPQERIHWGEAPDISACYGREEDLLKLERWIMHDGCRLVAVAGMSGMGKTTLVRRFAEQVKERFDCIYWQSLETPPEETPLKVEDLLADWIRFLSGGQQLELPRRLDRRITILLEQLSKHRCLLVLDNFEAVLRPGEPAGEYHDGCKGYGELLRRIGDSGLGESKPESCVLVISWEKPKEFVERERTEPASRVRLLKLDGLDHPAAKQILRDRGLRMDEASGTSTALIDRCSGNPLALNAIATRIREVFSNDPAQFLSNQEIIFDGVRELLNRQFKRLSDLEQKLMYWLAIEREATSPKSLKKNMVDQAEQFEVVNRLDSLQRRLLIEISSPGFFRLHNMMQEYVTDRFVTEIASELETGELALFTNHALVKAQAKEHIREMQVHAILKPIAERSSDFFRTREEFDRQFERILADLRERPARKQGYAGGNTLNLLGYLRGNVIRGYDFSGLTISQADLRDTYLHNVDFTGAQIKNTVFAESFGRIRAIVFNSKPDLLSVGTDAGEIHLWESIEGSQYLKAVLRAHTHQVRSVAFSPDGQLLASGSADRTIALWDVKAGTRLRTLKGHTSPVRSVTFRCDGEVLASASADKTVKLWNVNTGQCIGTLEGHTGWVRSVAFGPDGQLLASGSADGTVKLWNVVTGTCLRTLEGHTSRIRSVAFNVNGNTLASGGDDYTVKVWDIKTGQLLYTLQGLTNRIWSVTVGLNGDMNVLASGGDDQLIKLWNVDTGEDIYTLRSLANHVRSLSFNHTGDRLACGSGYNSAHVWDVENARLLLTLPGHEARVRSVVFSPSGDFIATASEDSTVKLWDAHTGSCVRTLSGHKNWVRSVAFSPDDRLLASGSDDETVRLWDVNSGQSRTLHGASGWVRSVAFSPDGRLLASGSSLAVQLWDVPTGRLLRTLPDYTDRVRAVAFSHDGTTLASSDDHMIRLWEVPTWECRHILSEHSGQVRSLAFSPDDRLLASGGDDETVKLWKWDAEQNTWACRTLYKAAGWVRSVAFSPDGRLLACGGKDEMITLWNVEADARERVLEHIKPYAGTIMRGVTGLTQAQKDMLARLGAIV